jgi:hypothetical protein
LLASDESEGYSIRTQTQGKEVTRKLTSFGGEMKAIGQDYECLPEAHPEHPAYGQVLSKLAAPMRLV